MWLCFTLYQGQLYEALSKLNKHSKMKVEQVFKNLTEFLEAFATCLCHTMAIPSSSSQTEGFTFVSLGNVQ